MVSAKKKLCVRSSLIEKEQCQSCISTGKHWDLVKAPTRTFFRRVFLDVFNPAPPGFGFVRLIRLTPKVSVSSYGQSQRRNVVIGKAPYLLHRGENLPSPIPVHLVACFSVQVKYRLNSLGSLDVLPARDVRGASPEPDCFGRDPGWRVFGCERKGSVLSIGVLYGGLGRVIGPNGALRVIGPNSARVLYVVVTVFTGGSALKQSKRNGKPSSWIWESPCDVPLYIL
jgi:hypothetical protein